MIEYSEKIRDRVAPIKDEEERGQIARVLNSIERYANGEMELNQLGHFGRAVCLGLLSEAVFRADVTSMKHLRYILWFCQWDVPADRMNEPQRMYDEKQRKLRRGF